MKTYRIKPVTVSRIESEKGIMTYMSYYGEKIWRPYIFWIIEGGTRKILVDTAIDAEDYKSYAPGFSNMPIQHVLGFEEALFKASIGPKEIDLVIQTHLHFDHCHNSALCKNAKILVQEAELDFAMSPHPVFSAMYSKALLKSLNFSTVKGYAEILPGIEVIPVPGHTPGCQAVSVMTDSGRAVISGFCSILENFYPNENIQKKISPFAGYPVIIPGIHYDAFKAYESIMKVKEIADIVLPVHEPSIMELKEIP